MERLIKWLDEIEDLVALAKVQARPLLVTLLLLAAFLVVVGAAFVSGPLDLLAAP
jgi:hypothetical protein